MSKKPNWGTIVEVGLATVGPLVVDLIRAFVDGDKVAAGRVADRCGGQLKSEAKLEAERARLARIKEEQED